MSAIIIQWKRLGNTILKLRAEGKTEVEIASMFGVTKQAISDQLMRHCGTGRPITWINRSELSRLSHIDDSVLTYWHKKKIVEGVKLGRDVYYTPEQVNKVLAMAQKHCADCGENIPFKNRLCYSCLIRRRNKRCNNYYHSHRRKREKDGV